MMGWRVFKVARFIFNLFTLIVVLSFSTAKPAASPYQDWPSGSNINDFKNKDTDNSWPFNNRDKINWGTPEDDDNHAVAAMATKVIAGVIIFLVIASFIAFLICLCCPICILAKMRNRRRGVVYHPAGSNGTTSGVTVQSGNSRTTVTVLQGAPRQTTQQSMVVATNTPPVNSPYPVQPSVTVMPSMGQPQYGQNPYPMYPNQTTPYPTNGPSGMPVPMIHPNAPSANELPPPYPGLPREMDLVTQSSQPAYNPYFGDGGDVPSPYAPTTAPYPTKH